MTIWERCDQEVANLQVAFIGGTLQEAQLAHTRAITLGATEGEVALAVRKGIDLMHRYNVLVLP